MTCCACLFNAAMSSQDRSGSGVVGLSEPEVKLSLPFLHFHSIAVSYPWSFRVGETTVACRRGINALKPSITQEVAGRRWPGTPTPMVETRSCLDMRERSEAWLAPATDWLCFFLFFPVVNIRHDETHMAVGI